MAPSLDPSFGARGPPRGFGRLALSWPATSAVAASEPPSLSRNALLTEGGSEVQVAGQDRARKEEAVRREKEGWGSGCDGGSQMRRWVVVNLAG
jgi:hypothetical protein